MSIDGSRGDSVGHGRFASPKFEVGSPAAAQQLGFDAMVSPAVGRVSGDRDAPIFAPPQVEHARYGDGSHILRSARRLAAVPRAVGVWLEKWAAEDPGRTFLAAREETGSWRKLTFGQALKTAQAIGQSLIERGLVRPSGRPILILADNGLDHASIVLGAMHVGVPVAPVSVAYARLSRDFAKLRYIFDLVDPELIYVDDAGRLQEALKAIGAGRTEIVASRGSLPGASLTPFQSLCAATPTSAVAQAFARVGPDTVAKILFTSGSTGQPKGVINTQRMMCVNQASAAATWPFLERHPPVIVDWLPWNHTFGANHNFNMMLRNGGTLYIDEGKPVPALIGHTVANLREISPTVVFNVPRGYAALLDYLETDAVLRHSFFGRLDMLLYAAAALPQSLWDRLQRLGLEVRGQKVPFVSSWGLTETAPIATSVHWPLEGPGNIGVPVPGVEVRLVPVGEKLEIRVKGDNVTPGYFKSPEQSREALDDAGWFKTGDAVRFADPADPAAGLLFDGRTAENFKLSSGTWVNVGTLRTAVIAAAAPVIEDAVITGHDRDEIGVLTFPSIAGLKVLTPHLASNASLAEMLADGQVRRAVAEGLARHNAQMQGSSMRVGRCLMLIDPPSIDAGEITDKGYLNQRAVLMQRAALVERLYADPIHPEVIVIAS
jgi:feruloyl-CoA synthase